MKNFILSIPLFLFSSLLIAGTSDCPHGALSKQFCDTNNDMMADTSTDPKEWIDPYTLVFGNVPSQSFMFDKGAKRALMEHIEKITGKQVEFFPYQTNAAELEAMRSGMLHVAGMNTGSVPTAVNCAGFHLFAMTAGEDGNYGYTMQIITYPGSGINSIYDLKGSTILFTSSSSNSGHKAPVAILKERFGMQDGIDYKSRFSGSHINSVTKVAHHEYKLAAIASGFTTALMLHDKIPQDSVKVIYESDSFPTTGYGYSHKLKPALAQKIEEAFKTFIWTEENSTKPKAFNKFGESRFIPANYQKNWRIIRDIDKANDITYDCR
jgi:phosphonate transport system substrate-binding protein